MVPVRERRGRELTARSAVGASVSRSAADTRQNRHILPISTLGRILRGQGYTVGSSGSSPFY